jgi:CBS domain-containing protein
MNVNELMTRDPKRVRPTDRLHEAVRLLWEHDCGALPVVDDQDRPVGVVTDRDACMAVYTQGKRLDEVLVRTAMGTPPTACKSSDTVEAALQAMGKRQLRRLPVVDGGGRLVGVLSIHDVVRAAAAGRLTSDLATRTLAAIGTPHPRVTPVASPPATATKPGAAIPAAPMPAAPMPAVKATPLRAVAKPKRNRGSDRA